MATPIAQHDDPADDDDEEDQWDESSLQVQVGGPAGGNPVGPTTIPNTRSSNLAPPPRLHKNQTGSSSSGDFLTSVPGGSRGSPSPGEGSATQLHTTHFGQVARTVADAVAGDPNKLTKKAIKQAKKAKKKEKKGKVRLQDVVGKLQRKVKRKKLYKELFYYLFFMGLVLVVTLTGRNVQQSHYVEEALTDLWIDEEFPFEFSHVLKKVGDVFSFEEFWDWVEGVFVPQTTKTTWYNGDEFSPREHYFLYNSNRLLGAIRFRQLRVAPDQCVVATLYSDIIKECFWFYNSLTQSKAAFGPPSDPHKYKFTDDTGGVSVWGRVTTTYPPNGFVSDLPLGANLSALVAELKHDRWLDKQSRAVVIVVNTVNANLNVLAFTQFLFEFNPGGGTTFTPTFRIYKLAVYVTPADFFRMFAEISLLLFIIYYIIVMALQLVYAVKHDKVWLWLTDPWNLLDILNLSIFVVVIIMLLSYLANPDRVNVDFAKRSYLDLDSLSFHYTTMYIINSINIFLCFMKMFKFLRVNARMSIMWRTLRRAAADLVAFIVFFVIVFLGFCFFGHLIFGITLAEFATVDSAISTCFQYVLGQFEYPTLHDTNRVLAPIFFLLFIFLVFFTLVNMFLAIINSSYEQERSRLSKKKQAQSLAEVLKEKFRGATRRLVNTLRRRRPPADAAKSQASKRLSDSELLKRLQVAAKLSSGLITIEELKQIIGEDAVAESLAREATKRNQSSDSDDDSDDSSDNDNGADSRLRSSTFSWPAPPATANTRGRAPTLTLSTPATPPVSSGTSTSSHQAP